MADRIRLHVRHTQKDTAKAAEAWWDPEAKSWHAPRPRMRALDRRLRAPNAELLDFSTTPTPLYREPSANSGVTLDAYDDIATILQGVTADEPSPWAIRAPYGWFCHMRDSDTHSEEAQIATVRRRPLHKPLIITQPNEWRHVLQHRNDVDWRLNAHITNLMSRAITPNTAVRWNPQMRFFESVTGKFVDWKELRARQSQEHLPPPPP